MPLIRTPNEAFANLPDYPFAPNYVEINAARIHYVDEGSDPLPSRTLRFTTLDTSCKKTKGKKLPDTLLPFWIARRKDVFGASSFTQR